MQNKQEFLETLQNYISEIDEYFFSRKLNISGLRIDHICYKCANKDEFEKIRGWFEFEKDLIYQAIISKRRIAIIIFTNKLRSKFGDVCVLELSDQKPDNSQVSSIDHVEIIWTSESLDKNTGKNYEDLKNKFIEFRFKLEEDAKPHHTTYNFNLPDGKEIKLSAESLVNKVSGEMVKTRDEYVG